MLVFHGSMLKKMVGRSGSQWLIASKVEMKLWFQNISVRVTQGLVHNLSILSSKIFILSRS